MLTFNRVHPIQWCSILLEIKRMLLQKNVSESSNQLVCAKMSNTAPDVPFGVLNLPIQDVLCLLTEGLWVEQQQKTEYNVRC